MKLSDLNSEASTAPYHLINTALNVQGSIEAQRRGRTADFFILSKHYCGGPSTGYRETDELEARDPYLNLGTAMAISGAAAAPNMGAMTVGPLVFFMALMNLRLGYWFPNPGWRGRFGGWLAAPGLNLLLSPGLRHLFREARGNLRPDTRLVNLSDGGHLENLAVYELLRRRCEVVVAIDAEADEKLGFDSLMVLQRFAWIDLGVELEIEPGSLLGEESGICSRHWVLGKIKYGKDEDGHEMTGVLVYIKSSVTGDEPAYVTRYRKKHDKFPHESTADQFFDEEQFEVYRALGDHIAQELVEDSRFEKLFGLS
jgi:hypothetical protein